MWGKKKAKSLRGIELRQRKDLKDRYISLILIVFLILIPFTVIFSSPLRAESESPKATITGSNQYDYFGWNVSSAGDVNGDGYDDIIAGAPGYDSARGRTYIFFGGPWLTGDLAVGEANVTLNGSAQGDEFGWDVSGAGDVNNDTFDDVIIGAPGRNSDTGAVYIFYGNASMPLLINSTDANVTIRGGALGDEFGSSVSDTGNINYDDYDDVIVGAPKNNSNTGAAYVFYGNQSDGIIIDTGNANVTLIGQSIADRFGFSVSGAGDANKDNCDDMIVGGPGADKAYIFFGNTSLSGVIDAGNANVTINSLSGDNFGWSVSGAGDVDNDGYDDVIVGAPLNNSATGAAYIFNGIYIKTESAGDRYINLTDGDSASVTLTGENTGEMFGYSVSCAGNVNGDSYDDIIVGAPMFTTDLDIVSGDVGNNVIFHSNTNGNGSTWSQTTVYTAFQNVYTVAIGDIDGDEDLDIVSGDMENNVIFSDNTNGDGSSWSQTTVYTAAQNIYSVAIGDIDGDWDLDIISGDQTGDVIFHNNTNGDGSAWTQITVYTTLNSVESVALGDIDGDGDLDIVSGDANNNVIFHNNTDGDGSSWTQISVYTAISDMFTVAIGDIDGDGDLDIVSGDKDFNVIFHDNINGDGSSWSQITVYTAIMEVFSVALGDIDGDEDLDIVSGDRDFNVIFHDNTNGDGSTWNQTTVYTTTSDVLSVAIGDMDGDGYLDIVTGDKNNEVIFHDNTNGNGSVWSQTTVYTATQSVTSVALGNIDGDEIQIGRAYIYYGSATLDKKADVILTGKASGGSFGWAVSGAGDMNGDGLGEVIVGAPYYDDGGKTDTGKAYLFQHGAPPVSKPVLTGPGVAPITGFNDTWFNFTVNYSHPFDKAPEIITLNLTGPSGGIFGLMEVDPLDINYADGKQYFYNMSGLTIGSYSFHLAANDTDGNWTETNEIFRPSVVNSIPWLSASQVNPALGYIDSGFNFSVIYTDLDNHAPHNITVNITGLGIYDLIEADPLDVDYTDGKSYFINISGFQNGTSYSFHFAANDTIGNWTETIEIPGPQVLNSPPILVSPAVDPLMGTSITYFNFTVIYMDMDNHPPDNLTLNLTGPSGGAYDLMEVDSSDMDYTDGKEYYYNTTLSNGTYSFHFATNDSLGFWDETIEINAPLVGISQPTLTDSGVAPASGYTDTWFNFTVNYSHPFDKAPENITLNLTGPSGGIFGLMEVEPSDTDYTDGKLYYYNISGLSVGSYSFHFAANDTDGNRSESGILGFEVFNRLPSLSAPQVNPAVGNIDTGFNFTVVYTDLDNHVPDTITVNITGLGNYDLIEVDPLDIDYTDGKSYYVNISSIPLGTSYTFHFAANDTIGDWMEDLEIDGPDVLNRVPILSLEQVDPTMGYNDTWFNFTVTYTDLDNHAPDTLTVNITNYGILDMIELDPFDTDYTDGKEYFLNISGFMNSTSYSFHFAANDTMGNWTETAEIPGPQVLNTPPVLLSPSVDPVLGTDLTYFNFTVTYMDKDNHTPDNLTLNLTGPSGGIFDLIEVDSSDMDYADGKEYYYNTTLSNGTYSFHFAANDTDGNWSETGEIFLPLVINRAPSLSAPQVSPAAGYIDTGFNFSVVYTDLDNHAPGIITVNITGLGIYGLFEDDPSDTDYTDGKTFYVNLTSIPLGTSYTFHFAANDTIGDWAEGPEMDGPDVLNRAPTLSAEGVDPTSGYTDTWFNFTVTYTDLDDHAPDIITVNITGLDVYDLFEADPLDMDYSDGKIYYFDITGIPLGTYYTFHFAANDTIADWAIVTSEIDAPDVQQRTATLTSFDKTVEYSDNIILNATLTENGTPVAGADVAFYIDINNNGIYEAGEFVGTSQTLINGTVSLSYTAMIVPGAYSYISSYQGTGYVVSNSTAALVVNQKPAAITAQDNLIEEGGSVTLNAILEDEDGGSLSNQNVEFYVDRNQNSIFEGGELVGSDNTDISGYVEVTYTPTLGYGSYGIWAKYKGSGNYSVTEGYASLIVQNTTNTPPVIVTPVPDQIRPEDSAPWTLDLTAYESDLEDSDVNLTWYLIGVNTSLYTVTGMNSTDDIFTFITVENAFGNDEVTLWLVDSSGGTCFQKLWVNITPVNDRPKIEAINPITVHYDAGYTYIFTNYVSDIETPKEELILTTDDPEHTTIDGLAITFLYPESMLGATVAVLVTVTDADGGSMSTIVVVRVSEDWVPELEVELPDVTLYEGETVEGVYNLDDYFSDPDGDALFYATGHSKVTIYIDPVTHVVDITAPLDWYGSETVTFNALDPSEARVEDIVLITVLPVNDAPSISDVPDLVVRFDQDYKFNLRPYISDEDDADDELMLNFIDPNTGLNMSGIKVDPNNNLGMIINLPESMNGTTVQLQIWVNDGLDSNFTTINITVSDDYPPELIMSIPDVSFKEDTEVINAFNVLLFFIDIDDPFLIYTSGQDMINVTLNPNASVDFSAPANWSGSENVTFRATDDSGALVECIIKVTVIPVNDAPTISPIPDQEGEEGNTWVLDISQYLSDIDDNLENLIVSVDSDYVIVVGHILIFDYPDGIESEIVTVAVSDGELENSVPVDVIIESAIVVAPEDAPWFWYLFLGILLAFLLGILLSRMAIYKVEDLLLITKSGVLITFASSKTEEEWSGNRDKDIVAAMFVAVQAFVRDAFARKEGEALKRMDYGDKKVLISIGNHIIMAAFISGHESKVFTRKMKVFVEDAEERFSDSLSKFTGYMEDFSELGSMLVSFLEGHYKKGSWKKYQTDKISEEETNP